MRLPRQSTSVALAVPFTGVAFAAGLTADLPTPHALPADAVVAPIDPAGRSSVTVPLTSLLESVRLPEATPTGGGRAAVRPPVREVHALAVTRPEPWPVHIPTPSAGRNLLLDDDGTLDTAVGVYSDCTGRSSLSRIEAAIDVCFAAPLYFVGHNPGVFSAIAHMDVGSRITYYDDDAEEHVWRVVFVHRDWRIGPGRPTPAEPGVVAQFQTCTSADGTVSRVLDVVDAS